MSDITEQQPDGGRDRPDEDDHGRDEAEAIRQLHHELASAPPIEVVAQAVAHLATLAYVRLGVPPEENQRYQDLDAARVLIDALGGMLLAVEGRLGPGADELYQALASLQMTYAAIVGQPGGQAPEPERPAEPGLRRPSGLWVPGQD
jgi:Domain of unknown function (DUF1844)